MPTSRNKSTTPRFLLRRASQLVRRGIICLRSYHPNAATPGPASIQCWSRATVCRAGSLPVRSAGVIEIFSGNFLDRAIAERRARRRYGLAMKLRTMSSTAVTEGFFARMTPLASMR
jgi:hypothetical protein